ncbi:uncharacterized protein YMR196W-like isoform X2 [Pecten maximus]|uniref:uncharacterized protein YMR196W-like isoform X2 n=1 Tax=Pecten maximus TaxID=6579 RepID=UPI001457EA2C|nr:uncharacterized protein YMR196W-like isoform X2 [Pecten maximus]
MSCSDRIRLPRSYTRMSRRKHRKETDSNMKQRNQANSVPTQSMGSASSKKKYERNLDEEEIPETKRAKTILKNEEELHTDVEYDVKFWGPYLSDRQWGTVREDTEVKDDSCWNAVGHDAARETVYMWGEDGLMGVSDLEGRLCASLALWNGKDAFLKERLFGLAGPEGNHGEDVKELYYYLDNTPDHSYMRSLYRYPMEEFPYVSLRNQNVNREITDTEFEIMDTGVFDKNRYWDIYTEYGKDTNGSLVCCYTLHNRSDDSASISVIPQFWYRNTWNGQSLRDAPRPTLSQTSPFVLEADYTLGSFVVRLGVDDAEGPPEIVFTENDDKSTSLHSKYRERQYYKDAFHLYVVNGEKDAIRGEGPTTKCAAVYQLTVPPGGHKKVCWGLYPKENCNTSNLWDVSKHVEDVILQRSQAANTFYQSMFPVTWDKEWTVVARQACAGLLWHKQYYSYSVVDWINTVHRKERQDVGCCGALRKKRNLSTIRNNQWTHFNAHDIMSVPDKWEFPWFAPWDTAFQMIPLMRLDMEFAKDQLLLLLSDRFLHPSGQMPGCEYEFGDMNPPIHAWSVLKAYRYSGSDDKDFLQQALDRLRLNYHWMWTEKCLWNQHIFHGGFLGLDNISAINRSAQRPEDTEMEQADATGWMAFFSLNMIEIALELGHTDLAISFLLDFVKVFQALNLDIGCGGLWHNEDHFYYDVLSKKGQRSAIQLRSLVGLVPVIACTVIGQSATSRDQPFYDNLEQLCQEHSNHIWKLKDGRFALSVVPITRLEHILYYLTDEKEFLSPYGVRSLSKYYCDRPYEFQSGDNPVKYTPGESNSEIFGGNSNWRGPIWLCMNYLLVEALETHHNLCDL